MTLVVVIGMSRCGESGSEELKVLPRERVVLYRAPGLLRNAEAEHDTTASTVTI